ncbi:NAD(P)H-hydrate dehydratase [Thermocrinis sp.]
MKVLNTEEASSADRKTIEALGIPSLVLMENASLSVARVVRERLREGSKVLVLAGKGNNGGDGLACARHLWLWGYKVDIFLVFGEVKGDAQFQLEIFRSLGVEPLKNLPSFEEYDLIIDAIFGTGFEPPVSGPAREVIQALERSKVPILSVDIPSGLSADSGKVYTPSVKADITVTFQFPKVCHLLHPASKRCGELYVAHIGIPEMFVRDVNREVILKVEPPKREVDIHKGKAGHVLLVGSSAGKTGALIMSARASTRAGAGLVSVGVPKGLNPIFEVSLVEEMSIPFPGEDYLSFEACERILAEQERFNALALGMGMGRYEEGQRLVVELLKNWKKPFLLDADGINNLADSRRLEVLRDREITILTPHVGEFERLSGINKEDIVHNLMDVAGEFAQENNCYLVLKSSRTAIATPDGRVFLSTRGTPAMAKGGVGDVLSGILVALIGRGFEVDYALKLGVFIHGLAGEIAEKQKHTESIKATDLIEYLPSAYRALENGSYSLPFVYLY